MLGKTNHHSEADGHHPMKGEQERALRATRQSWGDEYAGLPPSFNDYLNRLLTWLIVTFIWLRYPTPSAESRIKLQKPSNKTSYPRHFGEFESVIRFFPGHTT